MGYRSDVRIILSIDGFNELSKHVKEYLRLNKLNDHYNYLKYMDVVHRTKDAIYFGWNDIKWYETYDGVFPIISGLKNLQENQYSYRYMRIGEDYGDVDEYFFDGKNDENIDLEYPSMIRRFDDKYVFRCMNRSKEQER